MNRKSSLTLTSMLFVFATLAACSGGGNGGGGATPPSSPAPTPPPSPGPQASSIAIPKTGQTTCYDPTGTPDTISCTDTGQDGELQTGVAGPSPRFVVDNTGECVTDNLTGLMWTRNGNMLAGDSASTQPTVGERTWQEALDFSNNLNLCGFSDWHLPNRNELRSLINHQQANNAITLNDSGFNNVMVGPNAYWTSTSSSIRASNAWMVSIGGGQTAGEGLKTSGSGYVWPVRTSQ